MLGTDLGTIHNGVTTVQFEGIVQIGQTLLGLAVPRIFNPPVGLHEHGRSQVRVGTPPVARTGRRAARA